MSARPVNLGALIACARREVAIRERVYPDRVGKGRMSPATADFEIACMKKIAEMLAVIGEHMPLETEDLTFEWRGRLQ